jgi:hypothetical protein
VIATLSIYGYQLAAGANSITASYSGDASYNASTSTVTVTITSSGNGVPAVSSTLNGASFTASLAPGGVLSVFGSNLSPATGSAPAAPLPPMMGGTWVTINGVTAPLYYVSPTQLNIQVPYETPTNAAARVVINNNGATAGEIMTRRLSTSLLTMVALVSAVSIVCLAQPQSLLTHHVREATLNGQAQYVGPLPATQSMRLVVALPIRNQAALDNFLKEVYDPSSGSYRQFLTVEQFTARFGPSQQDYDEVIRFAETHGFTVVGTSRNRLNLDVTGSVAAVEEAFHLTMGNYLLPTENRTFYAPDREPTTDDLAVRLWHISGLDNYSIPRPAIVHRDGLHSEATTGSGPGSSFWAAT